MVPSSFGCGSAVLAAMAILAPSRAARSAIASPMPREAPVMNSVFPASDILGLTFLASLFACEECRKRGARLIRLQTFLEMHRLGIDLPDDSVKMATHQLPRYSNGTGRKCCDLTCCRERNVIDRGGIDHGVD